MRSRHLLVVACCCGCDTALLHRPPLLCATHLRSIGSHSSWQSWANNSARNSPSQAKNLAENSSSWASLRRNSAPPNSSWASLSPHPAEFASRALSADRARSLSVRYSNLLDPSCTWCYGGNARRGRLGGSIRMSTINSSHEESPLSTEEKFVFGPYTIDSKEVFLTTELSFVFVNLRPVVPGHILSQMHEIASCDGPEAGQTVPHVHIHILPRKKEDFKNNDDIYDEIDKKEKELGENLHLDAERKDRSREEMHGEAAKLRSLF